MTSNRRAFLAHGGMAFAALTSFSPLANSVEPASGKQASLPALFDSVDLGDRITSLVKVIGDLSGAETWISAQGNISAIRDAEEPLQILGVEGLRRLRCEKIENGYRIFLRDWVIYRDIHTGEVLDAFENPITGKTNQVSQILTSLHPLDITLDNIEKIVSFTQSGNDVTVSFKIVSKSGGEWLHLMTTADELNNPKLTATNARHTWVGHSPWLRWMDMGDMPGLTLWQSTGRKHSSIDDLRPELVADINRYYPGSLKNPETYKKPS